MTSFNVTLELMQKLTKMQLIYFCCLRDVGAPGLTAKQLEFKVHNGRRVHGHTATVQLHYLSQRLKDTQWKLKHDGMRPSRRYWIEQHDQHAR